jgi:hypothetical protein
VTRQLQKVAGVQHRSSGVIRPNGLEPHEGVTRIACLDTELNGRFITLDRDSLDLSTRYDFRDPSEIGASLVFVLAKDVLHSLVDGTGGHGVDMRICRLPDRPLVHQPRTLS